MRASIATLLIAGLAALAAGCGSQGDSTPVACLEGTGAYLAALRAAPGAVEVGGETAISECLAQNQSAGRSRALGTPRNFDALIWRFSFGCCWYGIGGRALLQPREALAEFLILFLLLSHVLVELLVLLSQTIVPFIRLNHVQRELLDLGQQFGLHVADADALLLHFRFRGDTR